MILELSPKCRKVFLLSRTHHKTYPEIAELCGISVGAPASALDTRSARRRWSDFFAAGPRRDVSALPVCRHAGRVGNSLRYFLGQDLDRKCV